MKVVDYGFFYVIYIYNGMKGFIYRELGVVGVVFNFDNIMVEIIFDKVYVYLEVVRIFIKIKGVDKVVCIIDFMFVIGLVEG